MKQSKNKIIFLVFGLLLIISLAFAFSGCVPQLPEVIEVTGVDITEEDQSMKVDESLQLAVTITPEDATNKDITWESDNPDVAIVDENGLVTASSAGTANITVTTEDGSFTDTIKITVTKPYIPSVPAVKKYEVTLGALEVNTDTPQPLNLNSRLTRQETTPAADIAGVEIEIFSNEERTINVATITTGPDGTATVNLPAGTYYYSANAEGYVDFLSELYQYFSDTLGTSSIPELGSFIVAGPREDITFFPMLKVWKVIFEAYEHAEQIPAGLSRDTVLSPPLEGVNIDIFEAVVSSTGRTVERSKVLPLVSISTGSDGTVETELPNGGYSYNASKEGYANYPSESPGNIFSIQRPLVIDRGYFEIQGADVAGTIQVPMERVYNVTVASVVGGTATVVSNPNTNVLQGDTVTVTISNIEEGKAFSTIEVKRDDTNISILPTEVTEGEKYTFTMPAEDVTVKVTIETSCTPPEVFYGHSNSSSDAGYNTSSVSVPLHPTSDIGDLVIIIFATDGDMGTVIPQDDFQEITTKTGSGYPGIAAFYKILDGTENDDFTCSLGNPNEWFAISYKITGHRNTDPIGNSNGAIINNSSEPTIPGIDGASCSLLIAAAVNNSYAFDFNHPTEMGEIFNTSINSNLFFQIAIEGRENAENTGTRTFSLYGVSGDVSGIMFEILSPNSTH